MGGGAGEGRGRRGEGMSENMNRDVKACTQQTRRLIFKITALSYQMYNLFKFLRLERYLYIIREKITKESFLT